MKSNFNLYNGKTVLVTGHTGFKGSWLCLILRHLGAKVVGYSLLPDTEENLFSILNLSEKMSSVIADIRDKQSLNETFHKYQPEIVFHLAAQPLVRKSYLQPYYTYDVNVNGTLNVLDSIQKTSSVRSFINVTTDKVYKNEELRWYLIVIVSAILLIGWNIRGVYDTFGKALQQSAFQVASIITTTGFATANFNDWPEVSRTLLIMLMFVGASAASTGGGRLLQLHSAHASRWKVRLTDPEYRIFYSVHS